ncbi:hypothetical protein C8A03DRAFT_30472 [Achaetomium macrosporum]|uniref:Uncharacterized protein n=1 Tax=Achaetomium macrosporum TaxID=79813 RepID=A0AAN7CHG9_9PEZI|nr:hypothetical protein C8A03DRAFT_30472 [Achaetomium macrosporum]
MDSAAEPVKVDDEPPSGELLTSQTETKAGDNDNDVEMASQTQAQEAYAESLPNSEPAVGSPRDRPTPAETATPSSGDSSHPDSGNHQPDEHKETGNSVKNDVTNNQTNDETNNEVNEVNKVNEANEVIEVNKVNMVKQVDHEDNNEELTPPPDSPLGSPVSQHSVVHLNSSLQDEIVVGTKTHDKAEATATEVTELEDVVMGEAVDDKSLTGQYPKRKRASTGTYAESVEDGTPAPPDELEARRYARAPRASVGGMKGIVVGYWRDSPAEKAEDKHGVIGFIDVRDRLRTRILPTTRDGRPMDQSHPIPSGPGGSWVTFDKVAFEPHLVGYNHHVVKEYVKTRAETKGSNETPEVKAKLDLEAVELAAEKIRKNPPAETPIAPLLAYGAEIPANAVQTSRAEAKKRRLAGSFGAPSDSSPTAAQPTVDNIPGTRPTRILIGHWKHSSEEDPADKHAVYGIIGSNDLFRVKLARETRDGRNLQSNFPNGPGGVWIQWDEVVFDPHLRNLSRAEVKEYCRVRQRQLDLGESPDDRIANETKAVFEAQQRVAQSAALGIPIRKDDMDLTPIAMKGSPTANGHRDSSSAAAGRHPLPGLEYRAANRPPSGPDPAVIQRANSLAHREIARLEAVQARANMRASSREASLGPASSNPTNGTTATNSNNNHGSASRLFDDLSRLNKVWEAQEANRLHAGTEDAKIYGGIKYQRKQSGPFQGRLVSQGTIITIDGEDYVEYRVLAKPVFF